MLHLKKGEIIPLKEDFLFKKVFGSNENIERLEEFFSIYFHTPVEEIRGNVKVLNDTFRKQKKKTKEQKMDVLADIQISEGKYKVDIEMNLRKGTTLYRNVLYASRLLGNQLKEKEDYSKIRPVLQINFDNYEINEKNERIIKRCFIKDETNEIITDALEIDHINIAKCKEAWYNEDINKYEKEEQDLIRLGALFSMINIDEFKSCLKEVSMSKEVKEDITEAVEEYSLDEDLLELYDKDKIIESDKILAREEGFKEGLEQGIEKGISQSKIEIAKNLLNKKVDINIISETTGLSIEEINKL